MRHVYANPASKDKTPGQKLCRQFFEEDYKRFLALYLKMEAPHSAEAAANPASSTALTPGEEELPVEELAEQLFAGWKEEESRRQKRS